MSINKQRTQNVKTEWSIQEPYYASMQYGSFYKIATWTNSNILRSKALKKYSEAAYNKPRLYFYLIKDALDWNQN